ncbi:Imm1 family immunity protein [Streptomyces sp. NBC_00012]|uniref:Imm1 family immunity protein n=1 Tax=Streptomyces sp. NBC_00012 TaxID=2975621 RepID=UPI00325670B0
MVDSAEAETVGAVESWSFAGDAVAVSDDSVAQALRARIADGKLESLLESSAGRTLFVVSNTERAMVMLLADPGDPGEHATDPGAEDWSGGFVLANGQSDEYPDADTVPLDEALRIVRHILATGRPPADAAWAVDR